MIPDQPFFTTAEAAKALGVSLRAMRKELDFRRIEHQRRPFKGGTVAISRAAILTYLEKSTVPVAC